jgi:tetratricopeptide (TPR) repeat protein
MDVWIDEGSVRGEAEKATVRARQPGGRPARRRYTLTPEVRNDLERTATRRRLPYIERRMGEAKAAFDGDRFGDAVALLAPLAAEVPNAASVRELLGLTYYRLDQWRKAVGELEAYRRLTGAVDQHPVLADCYRALRRWRAGDELWEELREASPSAELVTEGRIVVAGSLADRGRLDDAIALMAGHDREPRRVQEHHLRAWYVLGDLHDRGGDPTTAGAYFRRILRYDATFADVPERLATLGR